MTALHVSWLMIVLTVISAGQLSAMPRERFAPATPDARIMKVDSTMCDPRGCFTFGQRQSFRPSYVQPNYRPPTAAGQQPYYYRPGAQGRAPLYYAPPPAAKVLPPPKETQSFHVEWCRNQYRSYNPRTDRFVTYEGIYKTCNSPYD
ncbi:BA14K family protein [Rhizobium grahamii]